MFTSVTCMLVEHQSDDHHYVCNMPVSDVQICNMHVTDMNINVTDTSMHVTDANMGKSQFI